MRNRQGLHFAVDLGEDQGHWELAKMQLPKSRRAFDWITLRRVADKRNGGFDFLEITSAETGLRNS